MNIVATICRMGQVEQFKSGSYKKTIRIITDEKYPQTLEVEFWNDKVELLNLLGEGDKVSLEVNLNGRVWEGNGKEVVFMSLTGYKVEPLSGGSRPTRLPEDPIHMTSKQMGNIESNFVEDAIRDMEDDDDMPF